MIRFGLGSASIYHELRAPNPFPVQGVVLAQDDACHSAHKVQGCVSDTALA